MRELDFNTNKDLKDLATVSCRKFQTDLLSVD